MILLFLRISQVVVFLLIHMHQDRKEVFLSSTASFKPFLLLQKSTLYIWEGTVVLFYHPCHGASTISILLYKTGRILLLFPFIISSPALLLLQNTFQVESELFYNN